MKVPAFFASHTKEGLLASDGHFSGVRAVAGQRTVPFGEATARGIIRDVRSPAVVVDCDSLTRGVFTEGVLKSMKVRGADIWYMTYIETVDDVFDGFNTDAEMLMAPYHTVLDDDEFRDIHSVSDSVIPTVFVRKGYGIVSRRRKDPVTRILEHLTDLGFYKTCVLDTDDSLSDYDWASIYEDFPAAIPFTDSRRASEQGFPITIEPFMV